MTLLGIETGPTQNQLAVDTAYEARGRKLSDDGIAGNRGLFQTRLLLV